MREEPTPKDELLLTVAREYKAFHERRVHAGGRSCPRIVDDNTAHHYHEHADRIRAWRSSRGV